MFNFFKNHIFLFLIFNILIGCQLQDPTNNHGVVFLENRSEKLKENKANKNDVIRIMGQPHTKSVNNENEWFYIERILTRGDYHKLGQNVLKENNVLVLTFDKYGILQNKILLNKDNKNKVSFSNKQTQNSLTQKSYIEKFLSSIREKMYGRNR
jgi:outer membrane protein assembly factor BamE (lipoprotein component of BamABCDE complex)